MPTVCTYSFGAGIALPGLCAYIAESSPLSFSPGLNHQTHCPLNPPNSRQSLGEKKKKRDMRRCRWHCLHLAERRNVCGVCPDLSTHCRRVLWIYHSSGSVFFAPEELISCYSDLRKALGEESWAERRTAQLTLYRTMRKMRKLLEGEELVVDVGSLENIF